GTPQLVAGISGKRVGRSLTDISTSRFSLGSNGHTPEELNSTVAGHIALHVPPAAAARWARRSPGGYAYNTAKGTVRGSDTRAVAAASHTSCSVCVLAISAARSRRVRRRRSSRTRSVVSSAVTRTPPTLPSSAGAGLYEKVK